VTLTVGAGYVPVARAALPVSVRRACPAPQTLTLGLITAGYDSSAIPVLDQVTWKHPARSLIGSTAYDQVRSAGDDLVMAVHADNFELKIFIVHSGLLSIREALEQTRNISQRHVDRDFSGVEQQRCVETALIEPA
jgi:hypothetical protein